ncbi:hypothetical protein OEA41_007266 [Lepraria neglecta]|uniref:DNA damage-responsive protein 48 n=1 Tax=Lepraria neglecta TaxID=209136 RepID=A0AAD9ZG15_9LECA|nr:hypothetical protein OEA41_007266 [Lepraria neglecta]
MDFIKNAMGGEGQGSNNNQQGQNMQQGQNNQSGEQNQNSGGEGGGFFGGIGDKLNSTAGGRKESEKNEDYLDKGIDAVQQYGFAQEDQSNESAVEQAKDEQTSEFVRGKYKDMTGNDMPIKDKETRFG